MWSRICRDARDERRCPLFARIATNDESDADMAAQTFEQSAASEFQSRLKCNHPRRAIAAQPDAQQSCRWRTRVAERSESGLRGRLARNSGVTQDRQTE